MENQNIKNEIRREFQLERMVLFSDAVFAIVITLMAIEIHLPQSEGPLTQQVLTHQMVHLIPVIVAYAASFMFIGFTWYRHLHIFSILKDYDGKLVARNMIMLFFIGFFPFSANLITKMNHGVYLPMAVYFFVVIACSVSQLRLQHYILIKKPELRRPGDISEEVFRYKTSRMVTVLLICVFILATTTFYMVRPEYSFVAWWWFFPFGIALKILKKRIKKKTLHV